MRIGECLLVMFVKNICFKFFLECSHIVDVLNFVICDTKTVSSTLNDLDANVCCFVFGTRRLTVALDDPSPSL